MKPKLGKCDLCGHNLLEGEVLILTGILESGTNNEIIIDALRIECSNTQCDYVFISEVEDDRISKIFKTHGKPEND